MRVAPTLLVCAVVLLSGCTLPWQEQEEEDPLALLPPGPVSYRFEHDYLGNGRSLAFRIDTSTGTVDLRLALTQHEGVPACMPDGTPPYVRILKPGEELVTELKARNAIGADGAREDGSGDCSALLEKTVPRKRGVWRVVFGGSGNFTALATITGVGANETPTPTG